MSVLAAKLILTPLLVAAATLTERRWGSAIGGWLAGLPLTSGPVSVFLAVQQGRAFAAMSARATLLGLLAVLGFCGGYRLAAPHLKPIVSVALGLVFYCLSISILSVISVGTLLSILLVFLVLAAATWVISGGRIDTTTRMRYSSWDVPLRMAAATGTVLLITAVAERIGPTWSGLLSPFPTFAGVMAVFSHRTGGPQAAIQLLRGVVIGSFAFAAFFVVVTQMIERWSIVGTYLVAALIALLVNAISLVRILLADGSKTDTT